MKYALSLAILLGIMPLSLRADLILNEFHYDNIGGDTNEFIEVVTTGGESVADIAIELYNGSNSSTYGGVLDSMSSGFEDHGILGDGNRYLSWTLPSNGLQNGAPDGFALVFNGNVVEFLSYEGTFTAAGGTAVGLTSTDIGLSQSNSTTLQSSSIQRESFGTDWFETSGFNSKGAVNAVPEPSSFALLTLVSTCSVAYLRRRDT
ncbi:MAG: PEP-CTERM sorting domain-containing protein [Pirellulaceae bacterium]